jgi:hypothetical protein
LARDTGSRKCLIDSGPTSSPNQPSGIPDSIVASPV